MAMSETTFNSYLAKILSARYGEEVRGSIHDSLQGMYEIVKGNGLDVTTAKQTIDTAAAAANSAASKANTAATNADKATTRANDAAAIIETLDLGDINTGEIATKRYVDAVQIASTNILRGTNEFRTSFDGNWFNNEWSVNVQSPITTVEVVKINDAPNPAIVKGVHFKRDVESKEYGNLIQYDVPIIAGQTYTISAYFRGNIWGTFAIGYESNSYMRRDPIHDNIDSWKKISYTFTLSSIQQGFTPKVLIASDNYVTSKSFDYYVCGIKLELGDRATDWTPSADYLQPAIFDGAGNVQLSTDNLQKLGAALKPYIN